MTTYLCNCIGVSKSGYYTYLSNENKRIEKTIKNIVYDEKILGSFHIALGQAHSESDNGNRSAIHWDIVSRMNSQYGGGKILFDDELIMLDGEFIPKSLKPLNKALVLKK